MRHTFATQQWVPYARERMFAFFADPGNLPPLMPQWQQTRLETLKLVAPSPARPGTFAGKGTLITISFRPVPFLPLRLKWDAYIAEFHWNESFCDEQQRGPFRYFRHCHSLKDDTRESRQGTLVMDAVKYELPLGILGDVANQVAVKRQIKALFAHRQKMLLQLLAKP